MATKNVLDQRTNTYNVFEQGVIGFDRTTGQPIYGDVPFGKGGQNKSWLADQQAKYEKERISSHQTSSQFSGISDPDVINAIKGSLLSLTAAGPGSGKSSYDTLVPDISKQLADYSKQNAFIDAAALMSKNMSASMEAQKPAIQRAIEGSGTSAGSMQALLSQQLASKASTDASALGAEQAKAYGQIAASLMNTQVKAIGDSNAQQSQYASDIARLGDVLKTSSQQSDATSYFSAEQMNPKDGTGGKYRAKGLFGNYGLQQFAGGSYY